MNGFEIIGPLYFAKPTIIFPYHSTLVSQYLPPNTPSVSEEAQKNYRLALPLASGLSSASQSLTSVSYSQPSLDSQLLVSTIERLSPLSLKFSIDCVAVSLNLLLVWICRCGICPESTIKSWLAVLCVADFALNRLLISQVSVTLLSRFILLFYSGKE
ncbi:hypothetical protein L6452_25987 [Arctium lappa]|uniref:Uncharacterized protein n=1 Tax=Arctium lappa TaxID=4217 RepID=A0ACB9AB64_ARCLA|nr:hypothetical protein L6452_25987 [Arctium lappa]